MIIGDYLTTAQWGFWTKIKNGAKKLFTLSSMLSSGPITTSSSLLYYWYSWKWNIYTAYDQRKQIYQLEEEFKKQNTQKNKVENQIEETRKTILERLITYFRNLELETKDLVDTNVNLECRIALQETKLNRLKEKEHQRERNISTTD